MKKMKINIRQFVQAVFLAAIGIIIPMFMPKIVIGEVASYTLASHVPLFIAMFISPIVSLLVGLAIGLGFFLSGLPILITVRALSHVIWAVPMSFLIYRNRKHYRSWKVLLLLNLILGIIHSFIEVVSVLPFLTNELAEAGYFLKTIFLPIGIGGIVHSMIDFFLSVVIFKRIEFLILPETEEYT